ncbi:hypothetical protein AAFC00_002773 [Neodothiora populina]|uniref:Autophagy-related protein 14 n=1 Tax=Neodothiora populina TaxID=2781224 RepID=A0ABR3P877_9PEZI
MASIASESEAKANGDGWHRRERPWLIPSNRKLRHLHAITLRNVNLDENNSRPRRQTIDDEALPATLQSPAKTLALREIRQIGHSRSSDNLRPIREHALHSSSSSSGSGTGVNAAGNTAAMTPESSPTKNKHKTPPRPSFGRMRRRSTLEWASATSLQRQRKLEDVSASRMADLFFSLHIAGLEEPPIYVSEVIEKAMNPNFNHIDLGDCPPSITRLDTLIVRFWAKTGRQDKYNLLIDMTLSLRSLQFLGKSLASFHHPFPPNSILFQLTDGFYTAFTDARVDEPMDPFAGLPIKDTARPLPTSSFDALLRLSKLDDSVQDALALRDCLAVELELVVQKNRLTFTDQSQAEQAEDFVKTLHYATSTLQKQSKSLRQKCDEKRANIKNRRLLLSREVALQKSVSETIKTEKAGMQTMRQQLASLQQQIAAQRRRISVDVSKIYEIKPVPDKQLAFQIRGLHLPNSEDLDTTRSVTPEAIAAALGHCAHVVLLLSYYWGIVLPYHPHPRSSASTITDPISTISSMSASSPGLESSAKAKQTLLRIFPLTPKSSVRFRFEYGLFLLNKDVQTLLEMAWGVRVLDIRQTLPNLFLVLGCAGAGEGELASRRVGGVRGLLVDQKNNNNGVVVERGRGRRMGDVDLARRDSQDSHLSSSVLGSENGRVFPGGGGGEAEFGAFESLKRVGRKRERKLDGLK